MKDAEGKGGQGKEKADERTGSANVEEGASGADRRTNQDEGAESADERRSRNEEGIAGVDVVVSAGEVMAQLMREENGEKGKGERNACEKRSGMKIDEAERLKEGVERGGLVMGIGGGEVRTGDERG